MRILGITSYNGKNYQGWQRQPNGPSIQEEIEKQLSLYFNRQITIYGSGRTDAGVHALAQHFHFDVDIDSVDIDRLIYSINMMLPDDIKINDFEQVDDDFHARFSVKEKHYGYTISTSQKEVFFHDTLYVCPFKLDLEKMKKAITYFNGVHNFKNFTSKEEDEDNFVREIYSATIDFDGPYINFDFRGNGFMRYMIRFIVGTIVEVGRGKISLKQVKELLEDTSERKIVSFKAPASGLMLIDVIY